MAELKGVRIEDVQEEILNSSNAWFDPVQPKTSDKIEALKNSVAADMYEEFILKYGGPSFTYRRFLHARQFNTEKAERMLRGALDFRKEWKLDVNKTEEELEQLKKVKEELDPVWVFRFWGFTKNGNLVSYANIKKLDLKAMLAISEDSVKLYYLDFLDTMFKLQNYSNSPPRRTNDETKWRGNIEIVNLKGISMAHLNINGLLLLNRILKIAQKIAPEVLEKHYIINAPWFFSGAWAIIKKVLQPQIVAKVTISSGDCRDEIIEHLGSEELFEDMLQSV